MGIAASTVGGSLTAAGGGWAVSACSRCPGSGRCPSRAASPAASG